MTDDAAPTALETASSLTRDAGVTAAVAALFFLLRILAVSGWQWETAAEVAATVEFGDAASILLGTVFAEPVFTGVLIIALAPLIILTVAWPPLRNGAGRPPIAPMLFLAGILALGGSLVVSLGEWWIAWGTALATAVLGAVRLSWQHGRIHRATLRLLRSLGLVGVIGALVMAAGVSTPWVALEWIETDTGTIHGYVLETPSGFLKVLTDDPREVVILMSAAVNSREVVSG